MPRRLLVLSLLVLSLMGASLSAEPWQFIGPRDFGARVISLAVDPKNPYHLYAGSASGGLWERKDAKDPSGQWRYVNTGFPVLGVGAIAIHPNDPNILYIGTGEVYGVRQTESRGFDTQPSRGNYGIGILRSTDGGTTWKKSLDWKPSDRRGVKDLEIVPDADDPAKFTVWAATTDGVYKLDSTSQTWTQSLNVLATTSLTVHPRRRDEVVAVCGNFSSAGNGIYKTKDGGKTWKKIASGVPATFAGKGELARSPSRPDTLYATLGNLTNLWYSSAGVKHDASGNPVAGVDPNNLYKCMFTPEVFTPITSGWTLRSTDGGETWKTQLTEQDSSNTQGWYARTLTVDATDASSLFIGYMSPYRSFDAGRTQISGWAPARFVMQAVYDQANPSLIFVDFHDIVIAPTNPDVIYYACDQGVYRSLDRGLSAKRMNEGLDLMQFYRGSAMSQSDPNFMAGNPQDYGPGFMHYLGGGKWQIEVGYGYEVGYAALDDTNGILFLGHHTNSTLSRWQRGIADPKNQPDPQYTSCYIPDVDPFERSKNCLDNSSYNSPIVVAPSNPNVLYAARDVLYKSVKIDEHTYASDDGLGCTNNFAPGVTWAPTNDGTGLDGNPIFTVTVSRTDENKLLVGTAPRYKRMHVFASADGGRTYRDLTYNLPDAYPLSITFDPKNENVVYVTLGGYGMPKVWRLDLSAPEPRAWQDRGAGLPDVWASGLVVDPKNTSRLYVATDYGVFRSADGGATWAPWSEGLYPAVMSVELQLFEKYRLLRLFTHGNGVWERALD
ncbi:MAG TPA: hypothetical protein VKB93_23495 [Thermoanaerobaculia bacterium]|nr:hypothetical protein [Thermoanaerobaculia bacterium]